MAGLGHAPGDLIEVEDDRTYWFLKELNTTYQHQFDFSVISSNIQAVILTPCLPWSPVTSAFTLRGNVANLCLRTLAVMVSVSRSSWAFWRLLSCEEYKWPTLCTGLLLESLFKSQHNWLFIASFKSLNGYRDYNTKYRSMMELKCYKLLSCMVIRCFELLQWSVAHIIASKQIEYS